MSGGGSGKVQPVGLMRIARDPGGAADMVEVAVAPV